jgi:VWA domain-containing protein
MKTLTVVVLAATLVAAQSKPVKPHPRQIFVSVVDRTGAPVLDLQPSDFDVTENGAKRQVLKAGLAKSPMRVALLVDTSDGTGEKAINHIRAALGEFADALPQPHEIMLVTTARQPRVRVQPTTDRKKLKDSGTALFTEGGATTLSDTLMDIDDRFMRKAEDRWPVFVIVTGDGGEASAPASEKKFNDWLYALPLRGISAHAISLKYHGGGNPEIIAAHVAQTAGGHYDFINTSNSLPEKMKAIAALLAHDYDTAATRYQISFMSEAADTSPVDVGVARDGVKLQLSAGRVR